ncbi:hypothetical protein [Breoghania sp.]|uniref:hypothetical protein n=1 Tax=Breoghania sp. TaxID=2065378 RepID=UPI002601D02D|nr:hypothetical protein [Breoghania sp.]MDJ0930322.1 hypothetical protein [Breoghania sp.]
MSGLSVLKVRRVIGEFAKSLPLGLAIYFGFPDRFAFQDTLSLIQRDERPQARWLAAIEATGETSSQQPTLTLAGADSAHAPGQGARRGPQYQITSAVKGGRVAVLRYLDASVYGRDIVRVLERVRTNDVGKGNRLVSMAPDRQMVEHSAGSVYYMSSLISAQPRQSLPRVAFVQPQAVPKSQMVASANAATTSDGKPLNLNKMVMARAAAAAGFSALSVYAPSAVEGTSLPFAALFGMSPGPTPE